MNIPLTPPCMTCSINRTKPNSSSVSRAVKGVTKGGMIPWNRLPLSAGLAVMRSSSVLVKRESLDATPLSVLGFDWSVCVGIPLPGQICGRKASIFRSVDQVLRSEYNGNSHFCLPHKEEITMSPISSFKVVPGKSRLHHLCGWSLCSMLVVCLACAPEGNKKSTNTTGDEVGAQQVDEAAPESAADPSQEGRVLRHAVFFSFKESSTDEQIQEVVDAFRALPGKIDSIIDLQSGTNNSPEGANDGFTHCFLLSFKDDAGRALYLPHEAHKAFGDVLRPHMDKVFVIDYWGTPAEEKLENPLKHLVFFKFKDDAPEDGVKAVIDAFAALPSKIETIKAFEWGTNNSPEKHDAGFTHAFVVTFDSEEGRAAYLPHPEHTAFVEVLKPVLDKARVIDFSVDK